MNQPIVPRPPSADTAATVETVAQAEARVIERDRMLRWRLGRLRGDAAAKWQQQRGRAAVGAGALVAGIALLSLSRRHKRRDRRPQAYAPVERPVPLWVRWLPLLLSLLVPLIEPALRRRVGARVAAWLMAAVLAWRPRARR